MRELDELIDTDDPGIAVIEDWVGTPGANSCTLLPPDEALRTQTLLRLQVTTRSILGALAYDSGGIAAASGRLRLLGSGAGRSLMRCNELVGGLRAGAPDDFIIVADDILGGLYALNGGRFGQDGLGEVFYLAADELAWSHLEVGHSDFVHWCLTGDLDLLYRRFAELDAFKRDPPPFEQMFSFFPFLWTREAREGSPDTRLIEADEGVRLRLALAGFERQ